MDHCTDVTPTLSEAFPLTVRDAAEVDIMVTPGESTLSEGGVVSGTAGVEGEEGVVVAGVVAVGVVLVGVEGADGVDVGVVAGVEGVEGVAGGVDVVVEGVVPAGP